MVAARFKASFGSFWLVLGCFGSVCVSLACLARVDSFYLILACFGSLRGLG